MELTRPIELIDPICPIGPITGVVRQAHYKSSKNLKYWVKIFWPKKIKVTEPRTKNGPKGTLSLNPLMRLIKRYIPYIEPIIKEKTKTKTMSGQPNIRPKTPASLRSPIPIPFPRVSKIIKPIINKPIIAPAR